MATVIKALGPIRSRDGASFNLDDVSANANSYLDTIRVQANEILAQANKDAEQIRTKAEADGKQAAIRAVEKVMDDKVGKQLATLIPALKQSLEGIAQSKNTWLSHWEKTAVHVASQIAARVIRRELKHDPQITLTLVKEALELASGSAEIQLRMHPSDVATLGPHVDTIVAALSRGAKPKIIADEKITAGGCRVDTKFGMIDQQIESQLKRIEEELA